MAAEEFRPHPRNPQSLTISQDLMKNGWVFIGGREQLRLHYNCHVTHLRDKSCYAAREKRTVSLPSSQWRRSFPSRSLARAFAPVVPTLGRWLLLLLCTTHLWCKQALVSSSCAARAPVSRPLARSLIRWAGIINEQYDSGRIMRGSDDSTGCNWGVPLRGKHKQQHSVTGPFALITGLTHPHDV